MSQKPIVMMPTKPPSIEINPYTSPAVSKQTGSVMEANLSVKNVVYEQVSEPRMVVSEPRMVVSEPRMADKTQEKTSAGKEAVWINTFTHLATASGENNESPINQNCMDIS